MGKFESENKTRGEIPGNCCQNPGQRWRVLNWGSDWGLETREWLNEKWNVPCEAWGHKDSKVTLQTWLGKWVNSCFKGRIEKEEEDELRFALLSLRCPQVNHRGWPQRQWDVSWSLLSFLPMALAAPWGQVYFCPSPCTQPFSILTPLIFLKRYYWIEEIIYFK